MQHAETLSLQQAVPLIKGPVHKDGSPRKKSLEIQGHVLCNPLTLDLQATFLFSNTTSCMHTQIHPR